MGILAHFSVSLSFCFACFLHSPFSLSLSLSLSISLFFSSFCLPSLSSFLPSFCFQAFCISVFIWFLLFHEKNNFGISNFFHQSFQFCFVSCLVLSFKSLFVSCFYSYLKWCFFIEHESLCFEKRQVIKHQYRNNNNSISDNHHQRWKRNLMTKHQKRKNKKNEKH